VVEGPGQSRHLQNISRWVLETIAVTGEPMTAGVIPARTLSGLSILDQVFGPAVDPLRDQYAPAPAQDCTSRMESLVAVRDRLLR